MTSEQALSTEPIDSPVASIAIRLTVEDQDALFILLAEEGLVNRLGTGSVNNREIDLYIGKTREPLFQDVRSQVDPRWFYHTGTYTLPERKGKECKLILVFRFRDQREAGFTFRYGSESQGPPRDIVEFVLSAIRATDSWYEQQKGVAMQSRKPWWKFW